MTETELESELERQNRWLNTYRTAKDSEKFIKQVCEATGICKAEFNRWLADPEFEEKYWAERKAFSYRLEERHSGICADLLESKGISKSRFYALQIAQKGISEIIGKLNRERFGESTEIRLKNQDNVQPAINISLYTGPTVSLPQPNITLGVLQSAPLSQADTALALPVVEADPPNES